MACRTLHERLTRTIPTDSVSGLHSSVLWVISGLMSGEGKRTWWESRDVGSAPAPAGTDEELLSLTVGTTYFLPSEWKGNLCFLEKKQRKFILSQQAASLHCLRFSFSLPPFLSLLPHTPLFSMPLFPFPSTYSRCSLHLTLPSTLTTSLRAQGLLGSLPSWKVPRVALLLFVSAGIQGGEKMETAQWALHPKAAHDPLLTPPSIQTPQEDETRQWW